MVVINEGVSACGHGKEEENAAEMQRYGMVDEAETVTVSFEAESSPFRTTKMGSHGRR